MIKCHKCKEKIEDCILLCQNCHKIIHRKNKTQRIKLLRQTGNLF